MGYSTYFTGQFDLDKTLTLEQFNELNDLHNDEGWRKGGSPSSYCQWIPTKDGKHLKHDEEEKFYYYTEWMQWIIDNKLKPWGITASGKVQFQGEEVGDAGYLEIVDGVVKQTSLEEVFKSLEVGDKLRLWLDTYEERISDEFPEAMRQLIAIIKEDN